jgi:hypothetical protein
MKQSWIPRVLAAAVAGFGIGAAVPAWADLVTLADLNTVAVFDPATASIQSDWRVDGRDYLREQGFWYRIGDAGGEQPLCAFGLTGATPMDTNFDGLFDKLTLVYGRQNLLIDVVYVLVGGEPGSGQSMLVQTVKFRNTGPDPATLHFFQYADFDLTVGSDKITIIGDNTARQESGPILLSETADTPYPDGYRAALAPDIRNSLGDTWPTVLGLVPGPVTGDATWAFQWDLTIGPYGTKGISKVQNLQVPEPTTLAFLGLGLAGLVIRRGRRGF